MQESEFIIYLLIKWGQANYMVDLKTEEILK